MSICYICDKQPSIIVEVAYMGFYELCPDCLDTFLEFCKEARLLARTLPIEQENPNEP